MSGPLSHLSMSLLYKNIFACAGRGARHPERSSVEVGVKMSQKDLALDPRHYSSALADGFSEIGRRRRL